MASNESEYAKVGDTIIITAKHNPWYGKKFKVIQRPENSHTVENTGDVWIVDDECKVDRCLIARYYDVFSRNVCNDVEALLKKQLDKNLSHAFRFWVS